MLSRLPAPEGPVTIWLGKYSGGPPSGQKVERMSKFWRVVAPVVAAGGLVAAGAMPAASASPTVVPTYTVSIAAHSAFPRISRHTLVVYKTKGLRTATISGTVTGAVAEDVATLWSKPFGAKTFTATTSMVTLMPDGQRADKFDVLLLGNAEQGHRLRGAGDHPSGTTPDVTSKPVTVFVTEGGKLTNKHTKCSSTTCTFSYKISEVLPAAAYKTETHKHFYEYLAVGLPEAAGQVHPRQGRHGIQGQEDQLRRVRGDLHLAHHAPSWRGAVEHDRLHQGQREQGRHGPARHSQLRQ